MYHIPRNINKRFEFFPGWGVRELVITLAGAAIGLGISVLTGFFITGAFKYLIVLFFTGIAYLSTLQVMPDGSSALDMLKHIKRFRSSQKLYLYR